MRPKPRIVGIGEVLWDMMPDGSRHLGGAPMNVAVHAKSLGCAASVISAVGDDVLGREAIALLTDRHDLDASAVAILHDRRTGAVDVRLSNGQPTFDIRPDVAWDHIPETNVARGKAAEADAVVFGTLAQRSEASRRTIRELLDTTREHRLRVFDVNLRSPFYNAAVICESLPRAHVVKLNDAELPIVLSALSVSHDTNWPATVFAGRSQLRLLALTRGEHGSTLYTRDQIGGHTLPAKTVGVKDTVGAGDAFTAALIVGLLCGRSIEDFHRDAVELAAFVCSQTGATPALPAELVQDRNDR
jgi:fructokinase